MNALQRNTPWKLLAALLCCVFFGVAAGTAMGAVYDFASIGNYTLGYDSVYGDDYLSASFQNYYYRNAVLTCYLAEQQKEPLNKSQQLEYDKAAALLEKTNFRGRLLDLEGNVLWYHWLEDGTTMSDQVINRYYTAVEAQKSAPEDYYLAYWTTVKSGDGLNALLDYYVYDENEDAWCDPDSWWDSGMDYGWESSADTASPSASTEETGTQAGYQDHLVAVLEWGIVDGTPVADDLQQLSQDYTSFQSHLPTYVGVFAASAVAWLLCLVLLLYGTGHKKGVEGIYLAPGHQCPADLLLVLEASVVFLAIWAVVVLTQSLYEIGWISDHGAPMKLWVGGWSALAMLLILPFFTTVAAQLKAHQFLKRTLCYRVCRLAWRIVKWFCSGLLRLARGIRLFWKAVLGYCVFMVLFAFFECQMFFSWYGGFYLILAFLLGALGLALMIWWLLGWRKAQLAAEKLAQGDLRYQTDSGKTPWDLKKHIENLNAISGGMQKAVQEQMKSDRFRTELITNVSHDLKTPLTSIISYVDLLKKLDVQDPTAQEYIDVLDRKSQRLKTLTEDLVEASKAATGVLAVNTERLEAGQLIHQALGEYEARLSNAGLSVVTSIPERPVYIHADGRHLWRILDNLLGNCAKYAMPGTRVYVTLEAVDNVACIAVKNISAEPLNIPADELMERFVRGDSSRTNEGSGLGLSIAQSLAAIQGGTFAVSVDGDLFKAEVKFNIVD